MLKKKIENVGLKLTIYWEINKNWHSVSKSFYKCYDFNGENVKFDQREILLCLENLQFLEKANLKCKHTACVLPLVGFVASCIYPHGQVDTEFSSKINTKHLWLAFLISHWWIEKADMSNVFPLRHWGPGIDGGYWRNEIKFVCCNSSIEAGTLGSPAYICQSKLLSILSYKQIHFLPIYWESSSALQP